MDVRFIHPMNLIISGPTKSGKTRFTFQLIDESQLQITPPPEKILYCYGEHQPIFNDYPQITFNEGLPDNKQFDGKYRTLLVLDDLMKEAGDTVLDLFTKLSHHRDVSVIFITQNLFFKSKQSRTMNLNTQYIVLFKNPRDALQVATLGRQMFPGHSNFLIEAFRDATERPHGYLLIDLHPNTLEKFRIRTNIFEGERQYVYVRR